MGENAEALLPREEMLPRDVFRLTIVCVLFIRGAGREDAVLN